MHSQFSPMKFPPHFTRTIIALTLLGHLAFAGLWVFWKHRMATMEETDFEVTSLAWK